MALASGNQNFRAKVLLSFVAVFVISWLSILGATYFNLEDKRAAEQEELRLNFQQLYEQHLEGYHNTFSASLDTLTHPSRVAYSFTLTNKPFFFSSFRNEFANLNQRNLASHMYFSTAARQNIIRLHAPDFNGDIIDRQTTLAAEQSGEIAGGVEISRFGSLAYRVVKPIHASNQLRGFVELGRELDEIWDQASRQLNVSLQIYIQKDQLTEEKWREGKGIFGYYSNWEDNATYVEVGSALKGDNMATILQSAVSTPQNAQSGQLLEDGELYYYTKIPLNDFSGVPVATVVMAYPQNLITGDVINELGGAAGASAVALIIGLVICFFLLNPVAQSMQNRQVELEEEIDRRTEDLRSAKEAAEVANKAKSEFLSNMSHELRTPLNAIIGFSSIVKNDELHEGIGDKYQSYVGDIHHSGSHLLSIINDILDVSRIEAGEMEMRFQSVTTTKLLHECHQMINVRATDRLVPVIHENYDKDIQMDADPTRLKQIILNLLTNAVKFTEPPGAVRFYAEKISETHVKFTVKDEGIGVPAEEQEKVLRRFGQAASSALSKKKDEGTGLGLTLVQDLVSQHNGTFTFESTENVGTTVTCTLPIHQEESDLADII